MTSKTLASIRDLAIENRRIVWTCSFEAAVSKAEWSISYNYRFHIVTRFKSYPQITDVIFFLNACREIRRISKQDVSPKRSADNVKRSYIQHYSKNTADLTILLSCNFKGLVFGFCLNRKRNKCWLEANLRSVVPLFSRREGTPDTITSICLLLVQNLDFSLVG